MRKTEIISNGITITMFENGKIQLTIPKGMRRDRLESTYKRIEKDPQYILLKEFAVKLQQQQPKPKPKKHPATDMVKDSVFALLHDLTIGLTFELNITDDEKAIEELSDKLGNLEKKITQLIINAIK